MSRSAYALPRFWRALVIGGFVVFTVVGVYLIVLEIPLTPNWGTTPKPAWVLVAFWVLAYLWNGYWWLFRVSSKLEYDGVMLRWFAPLRKGEVPVDQIRHIGPSGFSVQLSVIKLASGKSIMTLTRPGFTEFATGLLGASRQATFAANGYEKFQSKISRGSAYRRIE